MFLLKLIFYVTFRFTFSTIFTSKHTATVFNIVDTSLSLSELESKEELQLKFLHFKGASYILVGLTFNGAVFLVVTLILNAVVGIFFTIDFYCSLKLVGLAFLPIAGFPHRKPSFLKSLQRSQLLLLLLLLWSPSFELGVNTILDFLSPHLLLFLWLWDYLISDMPSESFFFGVVSPRNFKCMMSSSDSISRGFVPVWGMILQQKIEIILILTSLISPDEKDIFSGLVKRLSYELRNVSLVATCFMGILFGLFNLLHV